MKKFKAFSLTEAMIIIVILAIAIAATTPIISRKIVNITEAGSTIGGGAHGRYEIFSKEIIDFGGDNTYEKTTDPSGGGDSKVIVFRRLDDPEYKTIKGTNPEINGSKKSTLYEQINDAEIFRDPNGAINYVKFKDPNDGIEKKFPVGGKIIIESSDVIYVKGCLDSTSTPKNFTQSGSGSCHKPKVTLPNKDNRIIEGNLVDKFPEKHPVSKNDLWELPIDAPDGEVTDIPWERLISGDTPIIDRPISPDPDTGDYIGTYTPGDDIQNITLHGVGGGGAGGGVNSDDLNSYLYANSDIGMSMDDDQIKKMQKIIADKIREVAKTKNCSIDGAAACTNITHKTDSQLVGVTSADLSQKISSGYGLSLDGYWAMIDRKRGKIYVLADTRYGMIYPHELLEYTKILGTNTQEAVNYQMPKWFDFEDINYEKFWVSEIVESGDGGEGGTLKITTPGGFDTRCLRDHFVNSEVFRDCTTIPHCHKIVTHTYSCCAQENSNGICISSGTCSSSYCVQMVNDYKICKPDDCMSAWTNNANYYKCNREGHGIQGCQKTCDQYYSKWNVGGWCKRTGQACVGTYDGQYGGLGVKSTVCHKAINGPLTYSSSCNRIKGGNGNQGSNSSHTNMASDCLFPVRFASKGFEGLSCSAVIAENWASATGGKGGKPYQGSYFAVEETMMADMSHAWCGSMRVGGRANNGVASAENHGLDCSQARGVGELGLYNYAFIWSIPYASNSLAYGEAGNAGEYKTVNISKLEKDESFKITLGLGGVWESSKIGLSKNGPDGTDTVVNVANNVSNAAKEVLRAKGGKGGKQSLSTKNYDLCFAKAGTCWKDHNKTNSNDPKVDNCCNNENATRSSKDVISTSIRYSIFDNIKSIVGNSLIIGTGTGRGGEGVGSRAGEESLYGQRKAFNSTGTNLSTDERIIKGVDGDVTYTTTPATTTKNGYKNMLLKPSELNFKGGDGAVIIVW